MQDFLASIVYSEFDIHRLVGLLMKVCFTSIEFQFSFNFKLLFAKEEESRPQHGGVPLESF